MQNGVLTGDYTCNVHAGEGGLDAFFLWNNREGMEYITYTGNFDSEGKALVEQPSEEIRKKLLEGTNNTDLILYAYDATGEKCLWQGTGAEISVADYRLFTPFRNIMNEFYARDTSRKIRSVFKSKGMSGKHLTGTVIYGYLWDEKREHWLVDEEAAEVVRRIFALTLEGYGPYQIACKLSADRIEIPVVHLARFNEGVNRSKPVKDPYGWGSSTIVNILKKREYLGHTINFKTRKHFKDKKSHYVSEDEWTIFENTHEAIIDQQAFDLAQKIRSNVRRYPNGWGEAAPLTGLLYCADCGGKMYVHRTNNGKRISQYTCSCLLYTSSLSEPFSDRQPLRPCRGKIKPVLSGVSYHTGNEGCY